MSERPPPILVDDMLEAVERIVSYTEGLDFDQFVQDYKTSDIGLMVRLHLVDQGGDILGALERARAVVIHQRRDGEVLHPLRRLTGKTQTHLLKPLLVAEGMQAGYGGQLALLVRIFGVDGHGVHRQHKDERSELGRAAEASVARPNS